MGAAHVPFSLRALVTYAAPRLVSRSGRSLLRSFTSHPVHEPNVERRGIRVGMGTVDRRTTIGTKLTQPFHYTVNSCSCEIAEGYDRDARGK